jgi:hypothetical protein
MQHQASPAVACPSCQTLAPMSTWRNAVLAQFPEFGHAPESWDLIDVAAKLGALLEQSARQGDRDAGARVLKFVLWAEGQSKNDERFVYLCQDILRDTVASPSLRSFFASLLNGRTLSQLAGYIEYATSNQVLAEMGEEVRLKRRGG